MKNTLLITGLIIIVGILGVANILLLKNTNKIETPTPTSSVQVPSPTTAEVVPMLVNPTVASSAGQPMAGSDKDIHGCIGSAGYSWCELKSKCLRVWEEKCE